MAADPRPPDPRLGESVQDVTERLSLLVREEIELAKAEVEVKAKRLARGAAIGAAAGIFLVVGLLFLLHAGAWGLAQITNYAWIGYLLMAVILFVLGGLAGFLASRLIKKGAPPTPQIAIEEAKLIRDTVASKSESG